MTEVTSNTSFRQCDLGWKGSQMRCLLLTSMAKADLRNTLKHIIDQIKVYENVEIPEEFEYYPKGFVNTDEAELDKKRIPISGSIEYCDVLKDWWLKHPKGATTPNWDMVVTAKIDNKPGFILIEGKAHEAELHRGGKPKPSASKNSEENHERIREAIDEARDGLNEALHCDKIKIDRDKCYQMSNRLAFAWKLARLGIPVVLIYLGFEYTMEMIDGRKNRLIENYKQWERTMNEHSELVGFDLWETQISVMSEIDSKVVSIYPIIRSLDIQLKKGSLDTQFSIKFSGLKD